MKRHVMTAFFTLTLCAPALAQSDAVWTPCLVPDPSMDSVIDAFQAEGWAFPGSNEAHIESLQAAAEPLFALQNMSNVQTAAGFDRHIAAAHERAEHLLIDAAILQRDGLSVTVESYDNAGGMTRCTFSGTGFEDVTEAFESRAADISTMNGHEVLVTPLDASLGRSDVTLYRVTAPSGATEAALAPLAAIVVRHHPPN